MEIEKIFIVCFMKWAIAQRFQPSTPLSVCMVSTPSSVYVCSWFSHQQNLNGLYIYVIAWMEDIVWHVLLSLYMKAGGRNGLGSIMYRVLHSSRLFQRLRDASDHSCIQLRELLECNNQLGLLVIFFSFSVWNTIFDRVSNRFTDLIKAHCAYCS